MAVRMRRFHQDDVRAKIQTSQLINRLEKHALGELDLSASQIKAIEVLIRKTLPDLSSVEMAMNATVSQAPYDLDKLDDRELDAVESALIRASVDGGSESGAGEEEIGSLH